jgi:hypothetical protein
VTPAAAVAAAATYRHDLCSTCLQPWWPTPGKISQVRTAIEEGLCVTRGCPLRAKEMRCCMLPCYGCPCRRTSVGVNCMPSTKCGRLALPPQEAHVKTSIQLRSVTIKPGEQQGRCVKQSVCAQAVEPQPLREHGCVRPQAVGGLLLPLRMMQTSIRQHSSMCAAGSGPRVTPTPSFGDDSASRRAPTCCPEGLAADVDGHVGLLAQCILGAAGQEVAHNEVIQRLLLYRAAGQ